MSVSQEPDRQQQLFERHFRVRYAVLTVSIFLPLVWAFATVRNVYPVASWTVMMGGGNLQRGYTYYILRGETISGEVVDLAPIALTDGLSSRTWGLVAATVGNTSFQLRSIHPDNAALLAKAGDIANLPRAARLPELLRAWGRIYNSRLPAGTPNRLKAVRLDAYRWPGYQYSGYDNHIESWREEL
ncbi:MAG: hypothetical protein ACREBG_06190 [Pyrinomonadaceae bacterium]